MNKKLQAFQDFLAVQGVQVPVWGFLFNTLLAAALAYLLSVFYVRYGTSLSNRKHFANNFVLLAMTTALVITIVKSSLALSLGLVGALSIVRFRAAIKEPEELMYLFLCIAIGLGMGAGQRLITVAAILFIVGIIWLRSFKRQGEDHQNFFLTVASKKAKDLELNTIVDILKKNCSGVNLRRFDEQGTNIEAAFLVNFENFDQLQGCKNDLQALDSSLQITFLDNKGIS